MTDKLKSIIFSDVPNWVLWCASLVITGMIGLLAFAGNAYGDARTAERYVDKTTYARDWENHRNIDAMRLAAVEELKGQMKSIAEQMNYNNRITERNNAILERLDKR